MPLEPKLVRVQEKGQVTLPTSIRSRLGIKRGDVVSVEETSQGILITPQRVIAAAALDRLGDALRDTGITLDEWIELGRLQRDDLIREQYEIEPSDQPD